MEIERIWANIRERWKSLVVVALATMAAAAFAMVYLAVAAGETFRSQIIVSGRIIQNEHYYIDAQGTANELASRAVERLDDPAHLAEILAAHASKVSVDALADALTLRVGAPGVIEVRLQERADVDASVVVADVVSALVASVEEMAVERFDAESPIEVDVLTWGSEAPEGGGLATAVLGIALLGLLTGVVAAILRGSLDRKVRTESDLRDFTDAGIVVVRSDSEDPSLRLRAAVPLRHGAAPVVLVKGEATDTAPVSADLAQVFARGGEPSVLIVAREQAGGAESIPTVAGVMDGVALPEAEHAPDPLIVHLGMTAREGALRLSPPRATSIVNALARRGVVIIDAGVGQDEALAIAFAPLASLHVIVVRRGRTLKSRVEAAVEDARAAGAAAMLVVH